MTETNEQDRKADGQDRTAQKPGGDDRRKGNFLLLVAAVVFIVASVWLIDAMLAARKADECIAAGRRNCASTNVIVPR